MSMRLSTDAQLKPIDLVKFCGQPPYTEPFGTALKL